jgi:hypothetical protein
MRPKKLQEGLSAEQSKYPFTNLFGFRRGLYWLAFNINLYNILHVDLSASNQVRKVHVSGGVSSGCNHIGHADVKLALRDSHGMLQLFWRLDKRHSHSLHQVPVVVTMEEPDTRVVRNKSQHQVSMRVENDSVSAHGGLGHRGTAARIKRGRDVICRGSCNHLEVMAM